MAIVYQGDAGLNAGITQAGGALAQALGQVLQQRKMQSQFKSINEKIKDKPLTTTLLQEILAEPGGMQYLQQFGPVIAPVLKEQARSQGVSQSLASSFPDIFGGPAQVNGAAQNAAPQTTPIQEANIIQNPASAAPAQITPTQENQSVQGSVPSISGVPVTPPVADSNRRGPQEQTVYQQGGQEGMGLNPSQEGGGQVQAQMAAASQAQPNATPKNAKPANLAELSKYLETATPEERSRVAQVLSRSPYQELRDYAKVLSDQAKEGRAESADIRKESRAEIAKYSEPFRDIQQIESSVKKLEKAKELIQNRKVSLDENQFRRLGTAILEDEDYSTVAQYFKTDEQKMLFSLLKDYFKTKDIGGSNPSTKEVLLSLSTLPSENMGKEANLALINELLKDAHAREIKANKISDLRASGKQYNFGEFQRQVEDTVKQGVAPLEKQFSQDLVKAKYANQIGGKKPNAGYVWAVNKDGSLGQLPKENAKKFEEAGGMILNGN